MSQKPKKKPHFFIFKKKEPDERELVTTPEPLPSPGYLRQPAPAVSAARGLSPNVTRQRAKRLSAGGLHDLVQCPLCLEKFNNAKMLPCQHTFCLACLQVYTAGLSVLECPICSAKTPLTSGELALLPSNLYIDSLLALVGPGGGLDPLAAGTSATSATPAASVTSAAADASCELFAAGVRCSSCQTLGDASSTPCCAHCKLNFCGLCWAQHMDDLKTQIGSILKQLESASSRLEHKSENFRDRCDRLKEQISDAAEDKISAILSEKTELLAEATELQRGGDTSVLALRTSLQEALAAVHSSVHVRDQKTDNDKVATYMNLHQNALQIINDVAKWDAQKFVFDKENFRIDSDTAAPSEAESEEPLVFLDKENNPLESEESLVMHYRSRNFVPHYVWRKTPRPGGIALSPWGEHLYICGMDTHSVLVVERTHARVVARLTCDEMLCPTHIAFMRARAEIYVTDKWKHCVHAFSKDGGYLRSLGAKGSRLGAFRSPEGIAADDEAGLLYVVDTGNDRVQVLQPDGKCVGQIGVVSKPVARVQAAGAAWEESSVACTELNAPTAVALSADRIVVLDSGNRRVKVYSKQHHGKLLEFGSLGQRKGQFRQPEVLAVDPLGFIVVGDSGNSRVQVFRPSGQLVRVFGGVGREPGRFGWISGIHVTKELDIIISDTKNHSVNFM